MTEGQARQKPLRVFVAGPYSALDVMSVLAHIGNGLRVCAELAARGYAPFCPWADCLYVFLRPTGLSVEKLKAASMAWLMMSDAVVLLPGWRDSYGALAEAMEARRLGIPCYEGVENMEAGVEIRR